MQSLSNHEIEAARCDFYVSLKLMHSSYILSELNWMPMKMWPYKINRVRFPFDSAHMEHDSEISEAQNSYDLTPRFSPESKSELRPKNYAQKTILQIRSHKAITPTCLERTYKHVKEFHINSYLYLYTVIITTNYSDTFALISRVTNAVPNKCSNKTAKQEKMQSQ